MGDVRKWGEMGDGEMGDALYILYFLVRGGRDRITLKLQPAWV